MNTVKRSVLDAQNKQYLLTVILDYLYISGCSICFRHVLLNDRLLLIRRELIRRDLWQSTKRYR